MSRVAVAGGGAAGMMAACAAAEAGHQVTLFEKNEKLGKKIYITGKGRCNVTNTAEKEQFFRNIVTNDKFLYSSIYRFDNEAMMAFLEEHGCPLKVERGGRVFPVSDHASDVTGALQRAMKELSVEVRLKTEVKRLLIDTETDAGEPGTEKKRICGIMLSDGRKIDADAVILACGGLSYPSTGSDGAGFSLAAQAGHSLCDCYPALVPLEVKEDWCKKLQGLSLKNVEVSFYQNFHQNFYQNGQEEVSTGPGKLIYKGFGEMLFTHFGVSGPLILSASSYYVKNCHRNNGSYKLFIDLKPTLDEEKLDKRLIRDFEENSHKAFKNALGGLFPSKLIPVMVMLSGIDGEKKVYDLTKQERLSFGKLIKNLPLTVTGTRGFSEAVITQGGIPVSEVNPSNMESRLCKGLYIAGEMLDIDALTGGFNLQLAWSTGHLAGGSVAW